MNGIQIPPEWFLESPGRNEFREFNGTDCLLIRPNRVSAFADARFGHHQQTTPLVLNHHHRQRRLPTSLIALTNDHHQPRPRTARHAHNEHATPQNSKNDTAAPRHHTQLANERMEHRSTQRHVAVSDVANDEQRHQSLFVVPGEYSLPIPFRSKFARGPGATSPWATWLPNDERRRCRRSSFLVMLSR